MSWWTLGCLVVALAGAGGGGRSAGESDSVSVLVVGCFHMGAQADPLNPNVEDLLGARRPAEIRQVVERLAQFRPNKIALEALEESSLVQDYRRFIAGDFKLGLDERHQIGFRLAKKLAHPTVYPIDHDQPIDVNELLVWAQEHGQSELAAQIMKGYLEVTAHWNPRSIEGQSISRILELMNSPRTDGAIHRTLFSGIRIGSKQEPIGADQISMWYARNIRIAANVLRLTRPGDRVLVLFGANHRRLLIEFLEGAPQVEVVGAADYLRGVESD